ncbi:MAG: tetratricopeptide repeat protein [Desulfobacteraceae bacterium]|nr:tetratricopeptide repeat protein [Desulfobacteraceae bacterium]
MEPLFQQAAQLHQNGQLAEAETLYLKTIDAEPRHHRACYSLGILFHQSNRNEDAAEWISRAIRIDPRQFLYYAHLGVVYVSLNKLDHAIAAYRNAVKLKPGYYEAWFNLGNALWQKGRLEPARDAYLTATKANPGAADAYNNLGMVLKELKDIQGAFNMYQKALSIRPDLAQAHNNLGILFFEARDLPSAITAYQRAIEAMPGYAEAHNNLGNALQEAGDIEAALAAYQNALEINPNFANAHCNMGNALKKTDALEQAIESYKYALRLKPDYAVAYNNMGNVYQDMDRPKDAVAAYHKALEIIPDYAEVFNNLGNAYRNSGKVPEAKAAYEKAIQIFPDYAQAYRHLAIITKHEEEGPLVKQMEMLYQKQNISDDQKINLCFGLGKIFEDLKVYDRAFNYIRQGNRLKRKTFSYEIADERNFHERLIHCFNRKFIDQKEGHGHTDRTPVFVMGMPRSGTSLVEQVLSSHPKVFGAGELKHLTHILLKFTSCKNNDMIPDHFKDLPEARYKDLGREYISKVRSHDSDAVHIIDKMPFNFLYCGIIRLVLPEAKIIHCRRSPLDTCFSIYSYLFTRGNPFAYDLRELGQYYLLYSQLMDHWEKILQGTIYKVEYESFVSDPTKGTRQLLDFLELEWDDCCLEFHKTKRVVKTASAEQVRRPVYTSSVKRWEHFKPWLEQLTETLKPLLDKA